MKNLKILGVLLVSLLLPIVVNAESSTIEINTKEELLNCIETTNICELSENVHIIAKDIKLTAGTISIPKGSSLTLSGDTKVSDNATIINNGEIIVKDGVLDASELQYGLVGLKPGQKGTISVKSTGSFISLDYWNDINVFENGWDPIDGEHLWGECEVGARVVSDDRTYVYTADGWKGAIERSGKNYARLKDALDSAKKTDTIKILTDVYTKQGIMTLASEAKNITFDLNGKTLDFGSELVGSPSTVNQNIHLEKGWTVTFKNGKLVASSNAKRFIQNYSNLTLEDVVVDSRALDDKYLYENSFNYGIVNIIGNTSFIADNYVFDVYYWTMNGKYATSYQEGTQVIINTTGTIKGDIEVSGDKLPSKSTLTILNVNHEGNLSIMEGYENNIEVSGGKFDTNVKDLLPNENYRVVEKDNKYVVQKKLNVLVAKGEGDGEVRFDKELAFPGETVTMTFYALEGYEFDSVEVFDENDKEIEVKNNKFVMPETDVYLGIYFKKIVKVPETTKPSTPTVKTDVPVLNTKEEVKELTIGVKEEKKVEEVLLKSLNSDKELATKIENIDVKVGVEIEKIDTSKIDTKIIDSIKGKAGKATIATFFDISIAVRNAKDNKKIDNIEELTSEIELMILLPENLRNTDSKVNREYFIIREHEGKTETIKAELSEDGKYLIFKSDKFSTYALAYEDKIVENVDVPKTFDSISKTLIMSITTLISVAGITLYLKKQLDN